MALMSDTKGSGEPAPAPDDDMRERFREALARKQGKTGDASANGRTGPVQHPHTAPAKPQRTFRRKSG
jgi:hypothetical protein